ncbi:FAD-binding oxidoreductase [Nordella sp. HKS 07]|uniref:NAD(P)/FAD-dependent oxidoreductase n=1 Tax=Nordella sp. HKS 07 TaxID=2712222 RepID=UPI0013E1BEA1|nr:FAD-dependent oxidoreductase [Nordella sp. HKS 07]QIG51794.1 FAD-binding oxidoreductase [Nordella sp. HKS 07]
MNFDVAVIGAGIAGVSAAAQIGQSRSVILLERESQPGYHTSGRSAAMFSETYGNATVRALSIASRSFLENPRAGFAASPILTPRGAMHVGTRADIELLDRFHETAHGMVRSVRRLTSAQVLQLVPVLKADQVAGGVFEPEARDIDTNELLQGYLRQFRAGGGQVLLNAEVRGLSKISRGWSIDTPLGTIDAEIIVNAAGSWADEIARLAGARPVGLVPKRRTAFTFRPDTEMPFSSWPLVIGAREDLYFKPDAGNLLVSPADETPSSATDAQPEEIDVAIAADRLMTATTLEVRHIAHRWAGLRTFSVDKTPVSGFDPKVANFMWLAGQGGYGFQTAPAMAALAAAIVTGQPVPPRLHELGISEKTLSPARFPDEEV